MASKKRLIIVPGACSHSSNWFDQIVYFKTLGYETVFIKLEADRYKNFSEAADRLFENLGRYLNGDDQSVLLAHSMGAMLLLKILSEFKYYQAKNKVLYDKIHKSRIIFLQMPLKLNKYMFSFLNIFKYWAAPVQLVYSVLFVEFFAWFWTLMKHLVLSLKKFKPLRFGRRLFMILDFLLNKALIINAVLGTKPWEFFNLVRYYKQFGEFTVDGFFIDEDLNDFQRAMEGIKKNKFAEFDKSNAQNYYFSYGNTDYFCEMDATCKFAKYLGAQLIYKPFSMHNPQHMFWCQEKLHQLIVEQL